jgi:FkbM family methyltransferase
MINSTILVRSGAKFCKLLPGKLRTALAYRLAQVNASGTVRSEVFPGVFLDLDLGDWIQRLYYLNQIDHSRLRLLKSLTPAGGTFVDIGANVGLYTCVMANHVGPTGSVVAFEPMPENIALLRRNIGVNRLSNVDVQPVGLSNRSGKAVLYVPLQHPGGPSAATQVCDPGGWRAVGDTSMTTLDQAFQGDRLDLIKVDVEGHEVQVLEGAHSVIEHFRPIVAREVISDNRQVVMEFATSWGYKVLAEDTNGHLTPCLPEVGGWADLFLLPQEQNVPRA